MSEVPRLASFDSTIALLLENYSYISRRCRRRGVDAFQTRILGQEVVCMMGEDAARLFYGSPCFTRRRAIPRPTLTLLQDFGSVAVLDGEAHRHRKRMFMSLMTPESIARLAQMTATGWRAAAERWRDAGEVVLDHEAQEIIARAVCEWAGVPLGESESRRRASQLAAMFDGAGSFGFRQLRGQLARRQGERWIEGVVEDIRAGRVAIAEESPARVISSHRGIDGRHLPKGIAAVELINLLRPTVAVSRFVTFAARALAEHPEWHRTLAAGSEEDLAVFVQEVRRTSPFFPLITGRVREGFDWRGRRFSEGDWVMLDLYGTNHDGRIWQRPEEFDPERFRNWSGNPFTLIPQGGGDFIEGHRCPGEWITIELMRTAVRFLTREIDYDVPAQDLGLGLARMPAAPRSGFVMSGVRVRSGSPA